ncbi:MAG TPA: hypothetical protein VFN67_10875 [Polyangiales bacterium]|nr:hypothetical protein [Polyangiales bacterium]
MSPSDQHLDVRSLTDEALVRQTLPLASRFGCHAAVAVGLTTLLCGALWGVRSGLVVLLVTAGLVVLFQRVRSHTPRLLKARAAEREFQRRFGGELEQDLAEARAQLAANAEIEVLGLFRGRVLPHGGLRSMRLEISAQPMLVVCASPALSEMQRGGVGSLEMVRRQAPLSAAQVERVRALIALLEAETLAALASFVTDGFPCQASLLQRGGVELHGSANLAGLPDQLKHHPSVRLLELFLELEAELFTSTALA